MLLSRKAARFFACVVLGALMLAFGCGDDQPVITVTAIDCPIEDIELTATITKRRGPSQTVTTATVTVKCAGEPVNEAQINVNFWGLFTRTATTNAEGQASASQVTHADTSGLEVTVTVVGQDGEQVVVVEPVPEN